MSLKQLEGIGSSLSVPSREGRIMSLADGLAKGLQKYLHAKAHFGLKAILLGEADTEAFANGSLTGAAPSPVNAGSRAGSGNGQRVQDQVPVMRRRCPGLRRGLLQVSWLRLFAVLRQKSAFTFRCTCRTLVNQA